LSEFDCANCFVRSTKVFPIFRLFLDDKIIAQGQTIILSSRNNLNTGNTFVDLTEQLPQSNSDNSYVPQTDVLSRFRLYPPDKF
jgi:hypothetical protein